MTQIRGAVLEHIGSPRPYAKSRPITVAEVELAPPGAEELLVRIEAAGVCHSDLSVVDGNRVRPTPMLLGHEAAGIVERVGDGVTDVAVGQRVVMTFLPRCGSCAACVTDGLTPCQPGSAANNAGTLLGGGIQAEPQRRTALPPLGRVWFRDACRGPPGQRRTGGPRCPAAGRRAAGLRDAHRRRRGAQCRPAAARADGSGRRPRRRRHGCGDNRVVLCRRARGSRRPAAGEAIRRKYSRCS